MADTEDFKVAKDFHTDIPFANQNGFYLKGANSLDWGMKKHLSNIFNPKSGNTVMFAFDHGYFQGPTTGLERLDLLLPKLAPYVDVFMGTRGALRACVPPEITKGIALRVSAGSSMAQEDLSHEVVAVDIDDAIRMNADCMAVQTFIGADGQLSSLDNLNRVINAGFHYSIPTLGVVAVGKEMARTTRFFEMATRIVAEMGVQMVKTYDCEGFEDIVAACPVPIVVAGGKKLPEKDALHMAYDVISKGAHGVDMGRNIFQSKHPIEMARAINKIVHEGATDKEAFEFYEDLVAHPEQ